MAGKKASGRKPAGRKGANAGEKPAGRARATGAAQQARLKAKYAEFRSLTARQAEVERARRAVFHNLMGMTLGLVDAAQGGDLLALQAMLKFAGIDDLPPLNEAELEQAKRAPASAEPGGVADPVEAFSRRVGLKMPEEVVGSTQ